MTAETGEQVRGEQGRPLEARVRSGAAWGIVNNLAMRFANIAVMVVVVRLVSPQDFGVFAVALTVSVVLSGFADWGVSAYLVRGDTDADRVAPTVALVACVSGAVLTAATVAAAPLLAALFGTPDAVGPIRVMALCLLFGGLVAAPTALLGREFRQDRLFVSTVVGFVPGTLVLLVLAFDGHGAMAFAWSRVVAVVFQGIAVTLLASRFPIPRLDPRQLRLVLAFGLPLAGANLVNYVLVNADFVLVGRQLGATMLGIYVLAFNVASWSTAVLSGAINGVAMPAFSRVGPDRQRMTDALGRATRGVCLVALPVSALTWALAEPLVLTLYGGVWTDSVPVLRVLAVYGAMFVVVSLLSNLMVGSGRSAQTLVIQLVWISTLVPAIALGAAVSGLRGAAWAHVVIIVAVVVPLYLRGVRPLVLAGTRAVVRGAAPPLAAALVAALAALLVGRLPDSAPLALVAGGLVGGVVYALVAARMLADFLPLDRLGPLGLGRPLDRRAPGAPAGPAAYRPLDPGDVMTSLVSPVQPLPRLLFLRRTRPGLPQFLLHHLAEQLDCLRLFFDVDVVDGDGDYDELCDRYRPDLVLIEGGVYTGARVLTNTHTHPGIPKAGFLNADAFDPVRSVFVAEMAAWGVTTWFTVSASMAAYTPEIADRVFVWPNFVDPSVHRHHGLPKVIPVALPGSRQRPYPWRNRVGRVLAQNYPALSMPHFGWAQSEQERRMSTGEAYSRLISSAWFAPSCGSFTQDLVRKHFEIPAARTCLIAERTDALAAAGFEDMVNCVLADSHDVLDKVDHLFHHRDELATITKAGADLVHRRHTAPQRRQVRDWYDLVASGVDDLRQDGPCAPVRAATPAEPRRPVTVSPADDRQLLSTGWAALDRGRHAAAMRAFGGASNLQYVPEAEVGRAYALLLVGKAKEADDTLGRLREHTERLYGQEQPDPVVWALHVRALLNQGEVGAARAVVDRYPTLQHPELSRIRATVGRLTGERVRPDAWARPRPSITPLPAADWSDWLRSVRDMLLVSGQPRLATALADLAEQPDPADLPGSLPPLPSQAATGRRLRSAPVLKGRRLIDREVAHGKEWVRSRARRRVTDEWLDAVSEVAERDVVDSAVIVEPSRLSLRERSLRLALARNQRIPEVVCTDSAGVETLGEKPGRTLVFVGARTTWSTSLDQALRDADVVLLDGTVQPGPVRLLDDLVEGGDLEVVSHSRDHGGHAVLRRRSPRVGRRPGSPASRSGVAS